MIWFSIVGLICGFLVALIGLFRNKTTELIIFLVCFCLFVIVWSPEENKNNEPKAIDVYRGLTTLQVTYKDSVAVDSVVIWKDK